MTTSNTQTSTPVCVVETNPHRQTSSVWTILSTTAKVIDHLYNTKTNGEMTEALKSNNLVSFNELMRAHPIDYLEHLADWEESLPIEAHFEAAIDCAGDDGHIIKVYWSKEDALNDGAPRYMSDEDYAKCVGLVF